MESHKEKPVHVHCITSLLLILSITLAVTPSAAPAKSLYLIGKILPQGLTTPIHAYDIGPDGEPTFQTIHNAPRHAAGAVGIAIDTQTRHLFITHEYSNVIQVINAGTMQSVGSVIARDASNLAGVVYDQSKALLYAVDRQQPYMFAYTWDPIQVKLRRRFSRPPELTLATAYGIALDEKEGLLYMTNANKAVTVYDTTNWTLQKRIVLSRTAISIALDVNNKLLYTGAGFLDDYHLLQYDLLTRKEKIVQVEENGGVIGLAVDPNTSLVYVTTGRDNADGGDNLLAFDRSLREIARVPEIGDPTGIAVPGTQLGYNPVSFSKQIVAGTIDNPNGGLPQVRAGENITYAMCFDNTKFKFTNLSIVDTLPPEVRFVSAARHGISGTYDPVTHTYTWLDPNLPAETKVCLQLTVQVDPSVPEGTLIRNHATFDSDQTPPMTKAIDAITMPGNLYPLNITKQVVRDPTTQAGPVFVDPGQTVVYEICYDNAGSMHIPGGVMIADILSHDVDFVSAEPNDIAAYDLGSHTCTWSLGSLAPDQTGCVSLVVQVKQDVPPATTITNTANIFDTFIPPSSSSTDVTTYSDPLVITGEIQVDPDPGNGCVAPSDTLTYTVCVRNDNAGSVTDVVVTDTLPIEVDFLSATGDGIYGTYDPNAHAYTWSLGTADPNEQICLTLTVRVPDDIPLGTLIANTITADAQETNPATTTAEISVCEQISPLNISKQILLDVGVAADTVYVDPGQTVDYAICFNNMDNAHTAQGVVVTDTLPPEVEFVSTGTDGDSGLYDPDTHTVTWLLPPLVPGQAGCVNLVVRVKEDVPPATIISNTATIAGDQIPPNSTDTTDVITYYEPLGITKEIQRGPDADDDACVKAADALTYYICIDNNNPVPVTDVAIVDVLPAEVDFVSAVADGALGSYDPNAHTYTWSLETVEPYQHSCLKLNVQVRDGVAGNQIITNSVIAGGEQTHPTTVDADIPVCEDPLKAKLCIITYPSLIRLGVYPDLLTIVKFPGTVRVEDIDQSRPILLYPGGIEPTRREVKYRWGGTRIYAWFPKAKFFEHVPRGYNMVDIKVTGKLKSGRRFVAEGTYAVLR